MTAIKKLIDGNGNQYFPQTHTNAVVDDNGYSVESRMQAVQDVVNQAQMAIGAVPSDLAPTEDSTNWVTSGGVYNALKSQNISYDNSQSEFDADNIQDAIDELREKVVDDEQVIANAIVEHNDRITDLEEVAPMTEVEAQVIANALCDLKEGYVEGVVNVSNSDLIHVYGSSFGSGEVPKPNKNWVDILSQLSDYIYKNYAASGSSIASWLYALRRDVYNRYSRYGIISSVANFDRSLQLPVWKNFCKALESVGIEPIIGSEHHSSDVMDSALQYLADQKNYLFLPCHSLWALLYNNNYRCYGDSGNHLGTRNIVWYVYGYLPTLNRMERPYQSLKAFRLRPSSSSNSLDELVFNGNEERLENFVEIEMNEYDTLRSNGSISFDGKALVSAVLPCEARDLSYVYLKFRTYDSGLTVYAKSDMVQPYPSTDYYTRFSVQDTLPSIPSIGDVYMTNGTSYTVSQVTLGENSYYCTIYCLPAIAPGSGSTSPGVLTYSSGSGTGPSSVNYVMTERAGLTGSSYISNDNNGHWVELTADSKSRYYLNSIWGQTEMDKVHFLIAGSGTFSIFDINVGYKGTKKKRRTERNQIPFLTNTFMSGEEYIQESTFGAVGTSLSYWTDDNGDPIITSSCIANIGIPPSTSIVAVSDVQAMNYRLSNYIKGKAWLEVWSIYPEPEASITQDSYDWSDLYVDVDEWHSDSYPHHYATYHDKIGLAWKISRFPIEFSQIDDYHKIRIYSSSKGLYIAKVSLKYEIN